MTANPNPIDLPALLLTRFVQALMSADADAACGAEFGSRNPDRIDDEGAGGRSGGQRRLPGRDLGQRAAKLLSGAPGLHVP